MTQDLPKSDNDVQATRSLDMMGFFCPEPVFRARLAMGEMNVGDILEVLADDPSSEEDIRSWTNKAGQDLLLIEKKEKTLRFLVRKVK